MKKIQNPVGPSINMMAGALSTIEEFTKLHFDTPLTAEQSDLWLEYRKRHLENSPKLFNEGSAKPNMDCLPSLFQVDNTPEALLYNFSDINEIQRPYFYRLSADESNPLEKKLSLKESLVGPIDYRIDPCLYWMHSALTDRVEFKRCKERIINSISDGTYAPNLVNFSHFKECNVETYQSNPNILITKILLNFLV